MNQFDLFESGLGPSQEPSSLPSVDIPTDPPEKPPEIRDPTPNYRSLKIEEDGDPWKGKILPKIRLRGRWLERAGFAPGTRVTVICVSTGVIELKADDPPSAQNTHSFHRHGLNQPESDHATPQMLATLPNDQSIM